MPDELWHRVTQRDRGALSRLLSQIGRGEASAEVRAALTTQARRAKVIAITGSAGVGKSSLIGRLIDLLRRRNKSVAVLACDPESPLTGGALLGDRVRMPSRPEDAGLFIRSLTAASGSEAIGAHVDLMAEALAAFGFEIVIVETAGAGQSDTAVRALADVVVLLVQPESGDELQWQKAGLLEIADVVVVHKADLPGSDRLQAQVQQLLNLPGCRPVPVLQVSAGKSTGLDELWAAIEAVPGRANSRPDDDRTSLLRLAQEQIRQRFERDPGRLEPLVARWRRGEMDDERAADELLRILSGKE